MRRRAIILAVSLFLAACGSAEEAPRPAAPPETTGAGETLPAPVETADVAVYFSRGEQIGAAHRVVEATAGIGSAALEALLAGPTSGEQEAGLATLIPDGTELLGLTVDGGVATVDLSQEFESGGGSLSMRMRVAQVVHTLTQFPTVERVAFRLDGRPVESIGGEGVVVSPPVGRADFEDLSPAILLETPAPGDLVTSPLELRGTANTFEATFMYRLEDPLGNVLVETFATATSGTGTRGTFTVTTPFALETPGTGRLVVYESSAEDGRPIHVVEIPVLLAP